MARKLDVALEEDLHVKHPPQVGNRSFLSVIYIPKSSIYAISSLNCEPDTRTSLYSVFVSKSKTPYYTNILFFKFP